MPHTEPFGLDRYQKQLQEKKQPRLSGESESWCLHHGCSRAAEQALCFWRTLQNQVPHSHSSHRFSRSQGEFFSPRSPFSHSHLPATRDVSLWSLSGASCKRGSRLFCRCH